jgi:hypothetical protein
MILKNTLATASIALFLANAAVAGDADFTLTNSTGYDIESVYVVPSKQKDWGMDHLQKSILGEGKSRLISFNKSGDTCVYDMSVAWVGFSSEGDVSWERLDLCEIHKITLHYNSQSKVTSITTE